jgi:GntR family transcriptional regulator, transcriptional repressor for pyruvate dehydrogenase complex
MPALTQADALRPIEIVSVTDAIQERITAYIQGNQMAPGDRLPSETTLARSLGVGRNALREALGALAALGILEARVGLGWYVRRPTLEPMARALRISLGLDPATLAGLDEIRICLQCGFMGDAMRALRPEDMVELRRLVGEMERRAENNESLRNAGHAFYRLLYSRIENPAFNVLIDLFFELYEHRETPAARREQPHRRAVAAQFRQIMQAVADGDEEAARGRLRDSLSGLHERPFD